MSDIAELGKHCREIDISSARAGIYILIDGPDAVYVGSSRDIEVRVQQHIKHNDPRMDAIRFDRAFALALPVAVHCHYEGALIRGLRPKYNGTAPADHGNDAEILDGLGLGHLIAGLQPYPKWSRR